MGIGGVALPTFFLLVLMGLWAVDSAVPKYAVLWEHLFYNPTPGRKLIVPIPTDSTCVNLEDYTFDGILSSVQTEGCIKLWDLKGCKGASLEVNPPHDNNTVWLGPLHEITSAVGRCQPKGKGGKEKAEKGKGKKVIVVKKKKPIIG